MTAKMKPIKVAEAEELEKVILPKIAEEVSDARAKGDLKENAEYIAARERQRLESDRLAKIKRDLSEAVVFDPTTATTSYVSFGTEVFLHDNRNNKDFSYVILGPWESNVEGGIISYLSPLGENLMDAKVGETRDFKINGNEYSLTVKDIKAAVL